MLKMERSGLLKRLITAVLMIIVLFAAPSAAKDRTFTVTDFFIRLAESGVKVPSGFTSEMVIKTERTPYGSVLSYDNSLFLIASGDEKERLTRVSVTYMMADAPGGAEAAAQNGQIFENICSQVIIATGGAEDHTKSVAMLRNLGIDGGALDGMQRKIKGNGLEYMMKLHSNGMLMMVAAIPQTAQDRQ